MTCAGHLQPGRRMRSCWSRSWADRFCWILFLNPGPRRQAPPPFHQSFSAGMAWSQLAGQGGIGRSWSRRRRILGPCRHREPPRRMRWAWKDLVKGPG